MAHQGGGGGGPYIYYFDRVRQQRYYYNHLANVYVYEDGSRVAGPPSSFDPRTPNPSTSRGGQDAMASHYRQQEATSPTREPLYTHNSAVNQVPPGGSRQYSVPELEQGLAAVNMGNPALPFMRQYELQGIMYTDVQNPQSQVRTITGTEPKNLITDPTLFQSGYRAEQLLVATSNAQSENLYPKYRLQSRGFFKLGRVFMVLWAEPAGESRFSVVSERSFSVGKHNERVFSKVRRFVVIREGDTYCSALPITTYGGQGVAKTSVKKSEHAIIHTSRDPPRATSAEQPGRTEYGMRPIPIRVVPDEVTETLDPLSRIDFGKIHTVQHNLKVRPLGNVHPPSMNALQTQFANVWGKTTAPEPMPSTAAASSNSQASVHAARYASDQAVRGSQRGVTRSSGGSATRNNQRRTEEPEEEEEDEESDNNSDNDSNEADSEPEVKSTTRRSAYPTSASTRRTPSTQSSTRTQAQPSTATAQSTWIQSNYSRLIYRGYKPQQAAAELVEILEGRGWSSQAAEAEVRASLPSDRP